MKRFATQPIEVSVYLCVNGHNETLPFCLEQMQESKVYHWIRSQDDFKIVFLKTLCEFVHIMMTQLALSVLNNVSREFQMASAESQSAKQ